MEKNQNLLMGSIFFMQNSNSIKIIPVACMYYNGYSVYDFDKLVTRMTRYEIDIITSGRAHLVIDGTTHFFYPGDICFRKPGQVNEHLIDTSYECLHLKFDITSAEGTHNFFNDIPTFISKKNGREITEALSAYIRHFEQDSVYNSIVCEAMLLMLKAALYKQVHINDAVKPIIYPNAIQKSIHNMHEHIKQPITIDELAEYCGYSSSHFQKIFRETTGVTPHRYLLNLRIAHAKEQLKNTHLSVGKIALECGFYDSNYFSATFKREVGVSPGQFREQNS